MISALFSTYSSSISSDDDYDILEERYVGTAVREALMRKGIRLG